MSWMKLSGATISTNLRDAVEQAILDELNAGYKLKVCIGTDSQVHGQLIEFASVIVFIREKQGGFMFVKKEKYVGKLGIKERMIHEVTMSIDTAYQLADLFSKYKVNLEVHADINQSPKHKSHQAFQEAMGYITGMGYTFKAKPHAFASTSCANKVL
jgi:predicted RNase H-related nuclease YkuK (DUF458 family)